MTQPKIEGVGHGVPRMLYASDGSDWYAILVDSDGHVKVDVISSALPTDAATQTTLALVKTAVEKIDDLQGALGSVATDILRVASKGGDKIFGFESVVACLESTTLTGDAISANSDTVPSGKIWVITNIVARNTTTALTAVHLTLAHDSAVIEVFSKKATIAIDERVCWSGHLYLDASDYITAYFIGAQNGDVVYVFLAGYQMNAP